jgi:hypothetical protein
MSVANWAGKPGSNCRPESWHKLHTALPGQDYALGWNVVERGWAGGKALDHTGSDL